MLKEHYRLNGELAQGGFCTNCGAAGMSSMITPNHGKGKCEPDPTLVKYLKVANEPHNQGKDIWTPIVAEAYRRMVKWNVDIEWSKEYDGINMLPSVFCEGASSWLSCESVYDLPFAIENVCDQAKHDRYLRERFEGFNGGIAGTMDKTAHMSKEDKELIYQAFKFGRECGLAEDNSD